MICFKRKFFRSQDLGSRCGLLLLRYHYITASRLSKWTELGNTQNKVTTMRYHFESTKMTVMKKTANIKCWRGNGETGTLINWWWDVKWYSHFRTKFGKSKKIKYRVTIRLSDSTSRYMAKRIENLSTKISHTNVHSSIAHNNGQKAETIQMSINWWVDKKYGASAPWEVIWQ